MDNINDLIGKIKNNSDDENKKFARDLTSGLSESQNDALNKLLSDKALIDKIINSPQAKDIINKIREE